MAVCLNGGQEPVLGDSTNIPKFSDVPTTHWAYNYVAYCVQQGIIAGRGDGTFAPDEPVTGSAAAKMFLCALGYRADLEGLTGNEWELNTNILANQDAGLYEGLSGIDASKGLSRDNTAQMSYNAVQAQEVTYNNLQGDYAGVLQTQGTGTMLRNRFDVVKVTGILEANDKLSVAGAILADGGDGHAANDVALEGRSLLCVTDVTDFPRDDFRNLYGDLSYKVATTDEMVGQEIVIYVRFTNNLSPNAGSSEVIGTPILTDNNTVVETSGRLKDPDAVRTALRAGGLTNIGNNVTAYLFDHNGRRAGFATGITDTIAGGTRSAGVLQRFIDNDGNGTPDYLIQIMPSLAAVTAVNSTSEKYTLSAPINAQPFADVVSETELAKGDVVLVTQYSDDKYYVETPETVEGTVTAYNNANDQVTIDGTGYGNGAGAQLPISGVNKLLSNELIGGEYRLYLDPFGNVLGYEEITAPIGNYAVVQGYSISGNATMGYSARIKLLMQNGSTGTYDVNAAASAVELDLAEDTNTTAQKEAAIFTAGWLAPDESTAGNNLFEHLVAYELDGTTVTLGYASEMNSKYTRATFTTGQTLNKNTSAYTINEAPNSVVADNSTVFFFKNADQSFSVVTGLSKLPTAAIIAADDGEVVYYTTTNNTRTAKAIYVELTGNFTSTKDYAFITGNPTETTDDAGVTVYQYPVVLSDGTTGTLTSKSNNAAKNSIWEYEADGDYVKFNTGNYMTTKARVSEVGSGTLTLVNVESGADMGSIVLNSTTDIWDARDLESVTSSESVSENDVIAYIADNVDRTIKAVYIYDTVSGDLSTAPTALTLTITGGGALSPAAAGDLNNSTLAIQAPVANNTKLGINYTTGADNQTVSITIGDTDIVEEAEIATAGAQAPTATHTITQAEINQGYVTVTVSISEKDKDDWKATYQVPIAFTYDGVTYANVGKPVTVTGKMPDDLFRLSNVDDVTAAPLVANGDGEVTFTMPAETVTLEQVYEVVVPAAVSNSKIEGDEGKVTNGRYNVDFKFGGTSYAGETIYLENTEALTVEVTWVGLSINSTDTITITSTDGTAGAAVTFTGTFDPDGASNTKTSTVTVNGANIDDITVTGANA